MFTVVDVNGRGGDLGPAVVRSVPCLMSSLRRTGRRGRLAYFQSQSPGGDSERPAVTTPPRRSQPALSLDDLRRRRRRNPILAPNDVPSAARPTTCTPVDFTPSLNYIAPSEWGR